MYHINLWHTKCSNLAEVRWPLWHMMYVMCTELLHCIRKPVGKVYTGFPQLEGWESPPTNQKFAHWPPSHQIFIPSHQKSIQPNKKNKNVIFSCNHCSCTIFVLISYSFETKIMLILILIDIQYSQNAVFSFEKFPSRQNHSSSGSHHLVKKSHSSVHYFLTQSQGNS